MDTRKLSKYAHLIEIEPGIYALYNALWLRVIFTGENLVQFVQALQSEYTVDQALSIVSTDHGPQARELIELMGDEEFLDRTQDDQKVDDLKQEISRLPVGLLYLIVSQNCNLRCKYPCYIIEALCPEKNATMTIEVAKSAIDRFIEVVQAQGVEDPQVILYGGEPLTNFKVIKFALKYIREHLPNTTIVLNTNGVLITPKIAKTLAEYKVQVALSLDGPQEIHDAVRVDRGGKGTFERVLRGYQTLIEHNADVGISCTISPANIDTLPSVTRWLVQEHQVTSFGFNLTIGTFDNDDQLQTYAQKAASVLIDCFEITRQLGVYEDRMMRRVKAMAEGKVSLNDCGGCGQQIVVLPDGSTGVCQAFMVSGENFYPANDIVDIANHPLWNTWRQRSPINIPECHECEALSMCGGGCPYNSLLRVGDIMSPDLVHCAHAKKALRYILRELWKQIPKA